MTSWHTYPKVYNFGHAAVKDIFSGEVVIQEKVDGSQFSFGRFGLTEEKLRVRSRGKEMEPSAPEKLFAPAVNHVAQLPLHREWTYRGETLAKPKHNALAYSRVPKGHVILFDINIGEESYLSYEMVCEEAARLGLEVVPRFQAEPTLEAMRDLLSQESILGGAKIEGVVVKNYGRFGLDGKVLMAKHVSEAFKEVHGTVKYGKPGKGDILDRLKSMLRTEARWQKALQHLREAGRILDAPQDIGPLIKMVQADIVEEEEAFIKDALYHEYEEHILRGAIAGLPEWYKDLLLKKQFEGICQHGNSVPDADCGCGV